MSEKLIRILCFGKKYLCFCFRCDIITILCLYASVAQLDRALDSDSKGRRFDSCRAHQKKNRGVAATFSFVPLLFNLRCKPAFSANG